MSVSFDVTKQETLAIQKIVARAVNEGWKGDSFELSMDLAAAHANGCVLDFQKLLDFPDFDFNHDIHGIMRHLNRRTGKLEDFFLPRCSR